MTTGKMWVLEKTDPKGVKTFYNDGRNEWHVDVRFADLVEYDRGLIWLDIHDIIWGASGMSGTHDGTSAHDVALLPVTITVGDA